MWYAFFMVSFFQKNSFRLQPKLRRLQDLQTEIYRQLQLLIPDEIAHYDSFQSRVHGSPLLKMDILERHPYTHFLRLTYQFENGERREIAPDAHIRIYNDAHLAEVTAFNHDQAFTRLAGPYFPQQQLFQRSWKQNQALDKWLSYLLHQGHSLTTMRATTEYINGTQAIPVKEPADFI
jgi:uncharacterized protein YqiB (DUF1249 family)